MDTIAAESIGVPPQQIMRARQSARLPLMFCNDYSVHYDTFVESGDLRPARRTREHSLLSRR